MLKPFFVLDVKTNVNTFRELVFYISGIKNFFTRGRASSDL